jgi:hypothetical protein
MRPLRLKAGHYQPGIIKVNLGEKTQQNEHSEILWVYPEFCRSWLQKNSALNRTGTECMWPMDSGHINPVLKLKE